MGLLLLTAVIAGVVAKVRLGKITGLSVAQSRVAGDNQRGFTRDGVFRLLPAPADPIPPVAAPTNPAHNCGRPCRPCPYRASDRVTGSADRSLPVMTVSFPPSPSVTSFPARTRGRRAWTTSAAIFRSTSTRFSSSAGAVRRNRSEAPGRPSLSGGSAHPITREVMRSVNAARRPRSNIVGVGCRRMVRFPR